MIPKNTSLVIFLAIVLFTACKKTNNQPAQPQQPLHLDSFEPLTATRDELVTIHGGNFSATPQENLVSIHNSHLTVISATTTTLVVKIPPRTESGQILVKLGSSEVHSSKEFIYEPFVGTLAGKSATGADNGQGENAAFNFPGGIALDKDGNIFVADRNNQQIRKITQQGVVTTIAGNGQKGFVNGNAADAEFDTPSDVAVDHLGNVYVADANNHVIRKISTAGVVTTLAGNGTAGFHNGPGLAAQFQFPLGLAIDAEDNIYIADTYNNSIRKLTANGIVTTVAGMVTSGFKDGDAAVAQFNLPFSVAIGKDGSLLVCDAQNYRVRSVSLNGTVSTLTGTGVDGFVNGPKNLVRMGFVTSVAVDPQGNIFMADATNNTLRRISADGTMSTFSANPFLGFADGRISDAKFNFPVDLAIDKNGNIFICDRRNQRIRMIE